MDLKPRIEDYTESEFLKLLTFLFFNDSPLKGDAYCQQQDKILKHIERISEHPNAFRVICFPTKDEEDSPEGVLKRLTEWRTANGKPGFKPA